MVKFALGQLGDIEIKQLKIFKAVVECGGFSAAEAELNISRPTISNHIAALENRLNISLCKRGRAGFSLTEEGHVVYDQTVQLLERMELFRNTLNNLGEHPAGNLKIALSDTLSTDDRCKLPEIYREFHMQAPEVQLHVEVQHMKVMEQMVMNNQIDIAIIPYHRKFASLNYIHLFSDQHYIYCGNQHPLFTMEEKEITEQVINQYKLIHAGLTPNDEVYHQLAQMNLSASSYHYEARVSLLLSGCYIGFLPEAVALPYVKKGELKPVATSCRHFRLGMAVISKISTQPNRARELFLNVIRNCHKDAEMAPPY